MTSIAQLYELTKERFCTKATEALCPITRAALRTMPAYEFRYQLHISHKFRYVYVGNPKTGGSTLKSALLDLEIRDTNIRLNTLEQQTFNSDLSPLKSIPPFWPQRTLSDLLTSGYRFITFVRNPYTRLISCYINKFVNRSDDVHKTFFNHFGKPPIDFTDFILKVCTQSDYEMNPHWRPQHKQIHYHEIPYIHIGRFDNFVADFRRTFEILGIKNQDIPNSRHLNKTDESQKHLAVYSKQTVHMVYERYRSDFELFGYSQAPDDIQE
ncbi:MAG: sulfotransferase family protein [Pseudomonadota bacterium]